MRRLGVLGGTFDPPHVGHLWLAALAADALELDRVLFMPAAQPPHKRPGLAGSADHRLELTRTAIADDPLFAITDLELQRPGPSFTVDSITELQAQHPGTTLMLLMAADTLAQIDTWRQPERLLELVEWGVGPRPGSVLPDPARLAASFGAGASRIHLLEGPALDVSSSRIRQRVAAGRTIRYLVPRAVETLIAERGLYRSANGTSAAAEEHGDTNW